MADKKKKTPNPSTAGNPMWIAVRKVIRAEADERGGLAVLTKADPELKWSTMYTAMTESDNAQWDTVQRIIRALGWTLAELCRRIEAVDAVKPKKQPRAAKAK